MAEEQTTEQRLAAIKAARPDEKLKINKDTNEVIGINTGKVYAKGNDITEALALQTQLVSGSAPNLSGRPDLFGVAPTEFQEVKPFVDEGTGKTITPRVATPEEMAQHKAGTLESYNSVRGISSPAPTAPTAPKLLGASEAPPTAPTAPIVPDTYDGLLKNAAAAGAEKTKQSLLGAPDSYDNQILKQKGALMSKLLGQDLTPDELKWLTPSQSKAVLTDGPDGERLLKAELAGLNTIVQGRKEMKKEEEERALRQYSLFAESGTPPDQLPEGFLAGLDAQIGLPEGTFSAIYASDYAENEQAKEVAALDAKIKMGQYLDTIPLGETVTIDGVTYLGRSTDGIEVGSDGIGRRYVTNPDGSVSVQNLGLISPPSVNSEFYLDANNIAWNMITDPATGKTRFEKIASGIGQGVTAATNDAGFVWSQTLPEGTQFNFYDARDGDTFDGQCGEFIRWASDTKGTGDSGLSVGNSWESKQAITDATIGTEINPVRVGDVFVQNIGQNGHIGIINAITEDPNGDLWYTLTEANIGSDGKITHNRKIKATESTLTGFARNADGLRSEFNFGPDMVTGLSYFYPGLAQQATRGMTGEVVTQQGEALGPAFGDVEPVTPVILDEIDVSEGLMMFGSYNNIPQYIKGYLDQIRSGQTKPENIPTEDRRAVAAAMTLPEYKEEANKAVLRDAQDFLASIEALKNHDGLNNAVGMQKITQRSTPLGIGGSKKADFVDRVEQLTGEETLNKLINAKSRGATFGALSEAELGLLQDASNRILSNKKGEGFKMGQDSFIEALDDMAKRTQYIIDDINNQMTATLDTEQYEIIN